jgi:hypothetical protein
MISRNRWLGALAALALVGSCPAAIAQTRPFSVIGAGYAPEGINLPVPFGSGVATPHWAVGVGNYLGLYSGLGAVKAETFDPDTFSGAFGSAVPFVFTGANGDQLATVYGRTPTGGPTGTYQITPQADGRIVVEFLAEFVPQPNLSTGKFKGVTGSWLMYAFTEPFVPGEPFAYAWVGSGSLTFPKPKR